MPSTPVLRKATRFLLIACAVIVISPKPAAAGLFSIISAPFDAATRPVELRAAGISLEIFQAIFMFEFFKIMYDGLWRHDWSDLVQLWSGGIIFYGIGWYVTTNQVVLTDWVLERIGTLSGEFAGAVPGAVMTPDAIAMLGWNLSLAVCQVTTGNIFTDTTAVIPQQLAALFLNIGFVIVAVEAESIRIGTQFCVAVAGAGIGLMATRWTRPFAAGFPRIIFATFILSVVVNAVVGLGQLVANFIMTSIAGFGAQPLSGLLAGYAMISAGGCVYMFFAILVPSIAVFLGATSPLPGGAAIAAAVLAMRTSIGSGGGGSQSNSTQSNGTKPIAQLEAATRTS
jgi:uncharacterized membrane protein YqaE (UPF0057 family)